jgi:hypothetical protein
VPERLHRLTPTGRAAGALCALLLAGLPLALDAPVSAAAPSPPGLHHCGMVSGKRWTDPEPPAGEYAASGTFYQVAAIAIPCRGSKGAGALAILASFHHSPKGFHCKTAVNGSGECYSGSGSHRKLLSFFIETSCATPAPPYTPYASLPAACHDFAGS